MRCITFFSRRSYMLARQIASGTERDAGRFPTVHGHVLPPGARVRARKLVSLEKNKIKIKDYERDYRIRKMEPAGPARARGRPAHRLGREGGCFFSLQEGGWLARRPHLAQPAGGDGCDASSHGDWLGAGQLLLCCCCCTHRHQLAAAETRDPVRATRERAPEDARLPLLAETREERPLPIPMSAPGRGGVQQESRTAGEQLAVSTQGCGAGQRHRPGVCGPASQQRCPVLSSTGSPLGARQKNRRKTKTPGQQKKQASREKEGSEQRLKGCSIA